MVFLTKFVEVNIAAPLFAVRLVHVHCHLPGNNNLVELLTVNWVTHVVFLPLVLSKLELIHHRGCGSNNEARKEFHILI